MITIVQIEGTKDYNFVYNNSVVAVALLQCSEYYLYFNAVGYNWKTVMLCYDSLKTLNENLKQEKIC